tara:strand:+ start:847 stop:1797 length:951 start_codon:yes stop_codon:yes gene_type:complete
MSCISPIDIKGITKPCTTGCSYKYNYGNSNCILANKGTYVEIKFNSSNTVLFNDANYTLKEARIYKPSLHTWEGSRTAGELVLNHFGSSENMYICIPIQQENGKGPTTTWFNKFMRYIPTTTNSGTSVTGVNKFSVNTIVPQGPYYYYVGTSPWCKTSNTGGPSNKIIVFPKNQAVTMTTSDFTNLTRISNSNQPVRTPTGDVFFNAAGTREGPISGTGVNGNTEVVDCVPVSIDGTELTGDAAAVNSNISDISGKAPSLSFDKIPPWFWTSIAIIAGIAVLFIIYFLVSKGLDASRTGGGGGASARASTSTKSSS